VALTEPSVVVEVGVARGYSSAAILHALAGSGGGGRLHSIDLPPLDEDAAAFVGAAVPADLWAGWRLDLGPSHALLPGVAAAEAPIDLFIHDADHSYASQREDLETVWPHLAAGAFVVVDDVWTTAALDFAARSNAPALLIAGEHAGDAIGLLRRPGAGS
jgi:predicted O-methyltransferase YrrM